MIPRPPGICFLRYLYRPVTLAVGSVEFAKYRTILRLVGINNDTTTSPRFYRRRRYCDRGGLKDGQYAF